MCLIYYSAEKIGTGPQLDLGMLVDKGIQELYVTTVYTLAEISIVKTVFCEYSILWIQYSVNIVWFGIFENQMWTVIL